MDEGEEIKPHRSIQDIIPPARSRPIRGPRESVEPTVPPPPTPPEPLDMHPNRPKGSQMFLIVIAIAAIATVLLFCAVTFFFHRATIEVSVNEYDAQVDTTLQAAPEDPVLSYQTVTAEDAVTKSVAASGSQHVENHASGVITVYNAASQKPERLITNTRFETPEGLVFRVHSAITIPGYTTKAGVKVPGAIDVTVYADEAGDKYNVGMTEFTLPGLKNSNQFTLIYARSKTAMSGGFVGEQAVVDPSLRSQTVDALKADLERSLRGKLRAPQGSLIFPETVTISYAEKTDTAEGQNAVISVSGTASAPAFPMQSIAKSIASAAGVAASEPLSIENPNELSVHLTEPDAAQGSNPVTIAVSGTAHLVAIFDGGALAQDFAGKNKDAAQSILPGYPGIADITVKIYPFWRSMIPGNPKDITIKTASGS